MRLKMKYICLSILALIALLIIGGCAFLLFSRDLPPPDDADLLLTEPQKEVPPEANGFLYIVEFTERFDELPNTRELQSYIDGEYVSDDILQELIDKANQAAQVVRDTLAYPDFQQPKFDGFFGMVDYPKISPFIYFARLLQFKAERHYHEGDLAEAAATSVLLLRLGNRIHANAEILMFWVGGNVTESYGLHAAMELARDAALPTEEQRLLLKALNGLSPHHAGLTRTLKTEYRQASSDVDYLQDSKASNQRANDSRRFRKVDLSSYYFQPNRTKTILGVAYRRLIRDAPLPLSEHEKWDIEEALGLNRNRFLSAFQPNAHGRILLGAITPIGDSLLQRNAKYQAHRHATRLVLAIGLFEHERGHLPDALEALVPNWLDAVPLDPFDGQPFRYSPQRRLVYAVGLNLMDNGGSRSIPEDSRQYSGDTLWAAEDAVFDLAPAKID